MTSLRDASAMFLLGAVGCLASGRLMIPALLRAQRLAPIRYEDCPPLLAYQETKRRVPTLGGMFVLASGLLVAVLGGGLARQDGWLILGVIAGFGSLGLLDDWLKFRGANGRGLRSLPKLLVALAIGGWLGVTSALGSSTDRALELPWVGRAIDLGWGWVPLAMLVIAGCAHAVNLTDGMDGLAPGCLAIAFSVVGLSVLGGEGRQAVMVPWCAAFAGACVGFLWFNSFPASVLLGDVGALSLGAALGAVGLLTREALWLMIIGGIFVVEALSVMLQVASYQWRNKRRIFRVAPIHHHFHLGGISEPKLVVRFWIVGLILAVLSLTRAALP